jgi:Tfp pilus assembly protein PilZ
VKVDVRFADRRDVLNAYWGYLSGGGLIIDDDNDLLEGERVDLHVFIEANSHDYELAGKVVRSEANHAVIAFDAGDSHNTLLTAALSDSDVELAGTITDHGTGTEETVHVFSLSEQGCCLRISPSAGEPFDVGTEVIVESADLRMAGCVVWASDSDRCVMFGNGDDDEVARARLRDFVQSIQS